PPYGDVLVAAEELRDRAARYSQTLGELRLADPLLLHDDMELLRHVEDDILRDERGIGLQGCEFVLEPACYLDLLRVAHGCCRSISSIACIASRAPRAARQS